MLLPVLFCLILPVAVLPVRLPERGRSLAATAGGVAVIAVLGWAYIASNTTGMVTGSTIGRSGIVDERAYYVLNTGHDHPIRAEDYLDYPRMRAMVAAIESSPDGGLLINTPSFTHWDVVPPPLPIPEGGVGHTVYFLNLGMTSMNVPLDVRVIDPMGLAYPLAAHSDRLTDGRIGHDKSLYGDWVVADTGMVDKHPWLPWYFDEDWVAQAKVALTCPETQDLLESSRADLTWERWKQNFKRSFEFAEYRFDRVPKYAIELCGLEPPPPVGTR
jgi:arabinofuranosyltransferase